MSWVSLLAAGLSHVPVRTFLLRPAGGMRPPRLVHKAVGPVAVGAAAPKLPRGRNWLYLYYISDHADC